VSAWAGPTGLRSLRALAILAALTGVYFLAGKLGLSLALLNASASAVWPPTGIALAAFLLLGARVWPAILLGAFFVNLTTTGSFPTSAAIACGNTLEGLVGAWLVERFANGKHAFDRPPDVFKFAALAGPASAVVSASVGVASLWAGGFAAASDFEAIWLTWWLGDIGGALVVAPLILLWATRPSPRWDSGRALEALLLLASLAAVGLLVFGGVLRGGIQTLAFLSLPFLLWAAFRFEPQVAASVTALLAGVATWGCLRQAGPFAQTNESLVLLQAFMGVSSLTTLALAAMVQQRRTAEEGLRRLQKAVETIELGVTITDLGGRILYTNPAEAAMHGFTPAELIGRHVSCFTPAEPRPATVPPAEIRSWKRESVNVRRDGTSFPVQLLSDAVRDAQGKPLAIVTCTEEISERKRSEEALRASEERYRLMFERNLAGVYRATVAGRLLECNEALVRMLGYSSREDLLRRTAWDLFYDRRERESALARLRETGKLSNRELRLRRKDGVVVWALENETLLLGDDGVERVAGTLIDITERKEFEQRIEFNAYHDPLTGLPNRALLAEQLERLLAQARWSGRGLAVLFLDLDDFKGVNDSLGHPVGDRLLQEVAQRLRDCLREDDAVARVGGDEFILLLPHVRSEGAARIAGKVLAEMQKPFRMDGHERHVTTSVGIALFPEHGDDADTLLRNADGAMYWAKEVGKNAFKTWEAGAVARMRPPSAKPA
jgi:diguanylate cyclase (GGDEF)-like protein/PAS domain S-box-containing protein